MNLFKRLAALLLAAVLIIGLFPVGASAEEQEPLTFETTYINPIYADIVSEEDIPPVVTPKVQTYETVHYVTTAEDAGVVLREQMKARIEAPVVHIFANISATQEEFDALCKDLYEVAITHTQESNEGDYILWHLSGYEATGKLYAAEGGYNIDITYSMVYHSNAEQEAAVDAAVEELLSQLNLSGRSDYEKVKAVYDYICKNVRYDKTSSGTLKHTAYAALIKKTAVCQGYASLQYRLLLELGVDTRVIAGSTSNGDHGWNIVELENLYYNADSTWDEGNTSYSWFLKSPDNFPDHNRFAEYTTTAFTGAYPMASADYVPPSEPEGILINKENFPDDNFRAYLLDQDYGADAVLTDEEIAVITRLDVSEMSIASLEGIEYFTELTNLLCYGNLLTSLDVSHNTKLVEFFCQENQITALDISKNTALQYTSFDNNALTSLVIGTQPKLLQIGCSFNNLTELDVSKASALKFLGCANNQLSTLDVSKNTALKELECSNNQLTSLDLSKNTALTQLYCSGNAYSITLDESNQFDLTTLPGSFDASKASNWTGASVSGSILTAEGETITYSYDLGNGETKIFTLKCKLSNVHSHQYKQTVTAPTCTEQGFTTYTCSCGYSTTEDYVDALGHDYAEEVTPPTCLEDGFTTFTCRRCSDTYVGAETEATGHHHEAVVTPPTCLEDGYTTYTCVCGDTYTEDETKALGHDYATKVVAPTCTEQGYTTYICIRCSDSYIADYVDPTNHSFGDWYQTKAPTETATGLERRDCANCDHYETREVAKLEPSDPYSGSCGDDLTWNFDETSGQLTVSGSGAMYGSDKLGWTNFKNNIRSVEIGSGATSVGAYAFADCENLTDVQMPNSVMRIAYNAFENCSSLTAVDIPDNVTEIAYGAFMDCSSLTAVDIPDNVTEISYSAFKDCTSLASLELPQNVMSISYHAFDNCTSLSEVDFPTSLASIGDDAFGSCTGLNEMHFTGNAPAIQSKAFSKVAADAYYPAANTTWTADVLQNYGGTLTWIAEGGTVEPDNSCGENITWAFEESTGTLTISGKETMARSNGISVMDDYARPEDAPWYAYQDQIITIIIEGTVDSIGKNAFAGCSNLTTVIIEEGVSEIDDTAFSDCDALENCYFEGTEDQWEDLGAEIGESTLHTESAKPEAHTETKETIAPTCTEQGYDLYTCSCGTTRKDNFTEPTDHQWDDGVVTKEPTAAAPGIKTYTCTVCKTTRTEEIPYEAPVVSGSIQRISGKDRVKTALSVARALKDTLGVEKFDAVIIATGVNEKFADALAGSYLANRKKAPILLYNNSGLSQLNVSFIKENLKANGTVYILGGDSAVPTTVEETLSAYNVVRLSGKTRYETNLEILKEAGISGNEILVATGNNFADSLSASAVGLPLLLVNGKNTSLTAAQSEFLKSVAGKKVTIMGGDSAVSEAMKAAIEAVTGVTAERISGKTRHNTSVLIAQKYFTNADAALITYSQNFPDGLAGGPLAYALGAPLLLTNAGQEAIANEYIAAESIESGYVLGGDSAVSDETARKVFGLAADAAIEKAYYTE